jgi:hypothetical protein
MDVRLLIGEEEGHEIIWIAILNMKFKPSTVVTLALHERYLIGNNDPKAMSTQYLDILKNCATAPSMQEATSVELTKNEVRVDSHFLGLSYFAKRGIVIIATLTDIENTIYMRQ